ncbi:MAG TPA: J domain-containing protein [Terriglobia bacterium]|jgi:curved DNA-binding protein CbpA|nr:J domain-containing protein [Terriglobia bacterium]
MARIKTFYDELGVGRDATASQIKHAFKEIAKVFHPDKNPPEKQQWAHEQMSRLNFIFETLTNPKTRKEYDELVEKYESMPLEAPVRRPRREQNAIVREYAAVSVEIMNLAGKYANCRLRMMIGASVGSFAAIVHLLGVFTTWMNAYPVVLTFSYFFTLIGGGMTVFAIVDYFGRSEYRRRIHELEERRAVLRQRMYEAYAS